MKKGIKFYYQTLGFLGLIAMLRAKWIKAPSQIKLQRNDCKHPFHLRLLTSDVPTYKQVYLEQEYLFNVSHDPKIIVDAGANIGLASIFFANKFPEATILAIEPEQSNFQLLKDNVSPYPNIIPIQAALWNKNEQINLVDPGLGHWGFMTETQHPATHPTEDVMNSVRGITVDQIMSEYQLDKIDILKIDIEGAEKEVFEDTASWLNNINAIIIELHERMKEGCNRSFYTGSSGFDNEWHKGENVYLSRNEFLLSQN